MYMKLSQREKEDKYYAQLHRKARRNRRSIQEALNWLEENYTGDTRKAHNHQMYADSWQTTKELQLRMVYRSILGLNNQIKP